MRYDGEGRGEGVGHGLRDIGEVGLGTADRASDVDSFHVNLLSVSDILERGCKVMNSQGIPSDTAQNCSFPRSGIWKRGMRRRPC